MNPLDYLKKYQNTSFKEMAFNEVDALILSMVSYVPFDEIGLDYHRHSNKEVLKLINNYRPPFDANERKLNYIEIAKIICSSSRFKNATFAFFKKSRDHVAEKQFQAITIILHEFAFVSFCGTDSTTIGWKEDFNMAYLETVPSEVEAVKYLKDVIDSFFFKKVFIGGHSKGGRLAITAAKHSRKTNRILGVYAFDAPNFPSTCYDEDYKAISKMIREYTPNESIIGRLMHEFSYKKIISSTNNLLFQHDAFSWEIDNNSFIYKDSYTERSTHIVNTINYALNNYDEEMKKQFIDTIFDFLFKMNVEKFPNEREWIPLLVSKFPAARQLWKETPKEKRAVVKKMLFNVAKDYLLKKKD